MSTCSHDQGTPHEHHHGHDHHHEHSHAEASSGKLGWAIALTLAFVMLEAISGYFAHSLALLSDAGHNFADAAALGFSWYAVWIARRPANASMTFGYHRVGILAALVNALSLVLIALVIVWEAIHRFQNPEPVHGWLMVVVAAVAIVLNVVISMWLHAGAKHDINLRSAYLHMLGDAISAFGVVLAGLLIVFSGWHLADPVVSFLIAGLILWSSWGILQESVAVLMEAVPKGIEMAAVIATIRNVKGVHDVHDLHVWTVGPGAIACSCHVLIPEQSVREGQQTLREVVRALAGEHKINHTTVQIEVEGHCADEMYCSIEGNAHIGHSH
jgi:cobalt-zinc-cadmium efflux system protein